MLHFELKFVELHFIGNLSKSLAGSISFFWPIATDSILELLYLIFGGDGIFLGRGEGILGSIHKEYFSCTYRILTGPGSYFSAK